MYVAWEEGNLSSHSLPGALVPRAALTTTAKAYLFQLHALYGLTLTTKVLAGGGWPWCVWRLVLSGLKPSPGVKLELVSTW